MRSAQAAFSACRLGESIQKYGYLPESHTDFIMAVIAEELGIFGVLFVIFLLGFVVIKGFYIARKCEDVWKSSGDRHFKHDCHPVVY